MPEHHHRGATSNSGAGSDTSVHCDHQTTGDSGMTNCNMSCCDQQEGAPMAPVAYVLPAPVSLASPAVAARARQAATTNDFFVTLDPLFPPPRA